MEDSSQWEDWLRRHKTKIFVGIIMYLFGVNGEQKARIKSDAALITNLQNHIYTNENNQIEAANKVAFRALFRAGTDSNRHSDSSAVLSGDTTHK